jgi:hypothetical protein
MLIYDQRNFDLHLTQLNCAIANWATIIRIIYRPTQMLLAFATANLNPCIGRREVLINHQSDRINKQISSLHVPGILIKLQTEITAVLWQWNKFQSPTGRPLICIHTKSSASAFRFSQELHIQQILSQARRSPVQSYNFLHQLKSETMPDFRTSDI